MEVLNPQKNEERFGLKMINGIFDSGIKTHIGSKISIKDTQLKYSKSIPIGWLDYENRAEIPEKDNLFEFDSYNPFRILIFGRPDSGKSFLIRAMTNRMWLANVCPIYMTDIAPEYHTCARPLQEEFKRFVLPYEKYVSHKPTSKPKEELMKTNRPEYIESFGFPMMVYYPYFLKLATDFELMGQSIFQYDLSSISADDLTKFTNFDTLSPIAKIEVADILAQMMHSKKAFSTIDDLIKFFDEREDLGKMTKLILTKSFKNLKSLGILGKEYPSPDIIDDIKQGYIPDINLYGWQNLDFKKYIALYLVMMINQILTAKERLPTGTHIVPVFEELHEFAPKGQVTESEMLTRNAILKLLKIGRKEGDSFVGVTQSPESIDPEIIEYCDYFFIPQGFERKKLSAFISEYLPHLHSGSNYDFQQDTYQYMSELKRHKDGNRDWYVLDKKGHMVKFTPLGVLSRHKQVGDKY